ATESRWLLGCAQGRLRVWAGEAPAAEASGAAAATLDQRSDDVVAGVDSGDVGADGADDAGHLVAEDGRHRIPEVEVGHAEVAVETVRRWVKVSKPALPW